MHEQEFLSRFARRLSQKARKENGGGHALTNGAKPRRRVIPQATPGVGVNGLEKRGQHSLL
jgi:hypothetical protein